MNSTSVEKRMATGKIGRLDAARWEFLSHLLAARSYRRGLLRDRLGIVNPFADVIERSFSIHRGYDAVVCYNFYSYDHYARQYSRHLGYDNVEYQYKHYYLHSHSNKYSCYVSEGTDSDDSSATDMDD